jgi:alpha-tubulin suppressor-like RCC1 family protein
VSRAFSIENGKLYECKDCNLKLIKMPQINDRIVEIACGGSHVLLRTSSKKIYTFGSGKEGQLGHGNYFAV